MPKTIEITTYQYEELTEAAQAKARDWYRECSQGDLFWSECVIERATDLLARIGVTLDKSGINWSGFCSQGDGASFTGTYTPTFPVTYSTDGWQPDDRFSAIVERLERIRNKYFACELPMTLTTTITRRSSMYAHNRTVEIETTPYDKDGAEVDAVPSTWATDAEEIAECLRDLMTWIYDDLEESYTDSESDPIVAENIIANDYAFLASGARCTLGGD